MKINKVPAGGFIGTPATPDEVNRANRGLTNDGQGLYRQGWTVIASNELRSVPIIVRGESRTQIGFPTFLYKEDGTFVKHGIVSARTLIGYVYPNETDACGAKRQVSGVDALGNTPTEIAAAMIEDGLAIKYTGTGALCKPVWREAEKRMDFSAMTRRDYPLYAVSKLPDNIKADLEAEPAKAK